MAAAVPPRIGTEFAGYRIEGLVGRGGMSVVYRAEHPRLGARVALKLLAPELSEDEGFRERFVRETRLAAALHHPNVIPIYDAGEWQGTLYLAMRFVPGGDLKSLIARDRPLSLDRVADIVGQVAAALDAAHADGLIHRDIKPANVLVDEHGAARAADFVYLADFGLTKRLRTEVRATDTGDLLGTIDYVAPELIEGHPIDARADVYSLGCVAYETLTGAVPFPKETEAAILWAHMKEKPPRPSAVRPDLPEAVDDAVVTAMAKRPDDRFTAAGDLAHALAREMLESTARGGFWARRSRGGSLPPPAADGRRRVSLRAAVPAALALLVLGAAGAAAVVLASRDDPRAEVQRVTTVQTVTVDPTGEFQPAELELLRYIPDTIQPTCEADQAAIGPDFDVGLRCRPPGLSFSVRYLHARTGPLLTDFFVARVARAGIPIEEGGVIDETGVCEDGVPDVNRWVPADLAGHAELDPFADEEGTGRVLCHRDRTLYRIEWTYPDLGVYSVITGMRWEQLYPAWLEGLGPIQ